MNLEAGEVKLLRHNEEPRCGGRFGVVWRLVVVVMVSAFFVVTQCTNYTHHFHAHIAKHRILRNLQEQPALRFTFELKRKAMYVHGASTFDVVAIPAPKRSADDKSMEYNGIASFEKDGHLHVYSLVNGTAYYTRYQNNEIVSDTETGCLPSGIVPPIGSVLNAIETATTATKSRVSNDKCPNGSVMVFQFAGEDFVLCSRQSSWSWLQDDGFQIFGKDLNIGVKSEQSAPIIVPLPVSTDNLKTCGKVPFGDHIPPSLTSMLTRSFFEWSHRSLRAAKAEFDLFGKAWDFITNDAFDFVSDEACGCKGIKRPCVFIVGLTSHKDHGLTNDDKYKYFGDELDEHTPCCSRRQYISLNAKEHHWNSTWFQQSLVDMILQVSSTSDKGKRTVKDTIIIAHSMANLILSGAIANKKVILDPSTSWVASSAPMTGSMGANYIQDKCSSGRGIVSKIIDLLGKCPVNAGQKSLFYKHSDHSCKQLDDSYIAAQAAYKAHVTGVICSRSFTGLVSTRLALYALAGEILPHHSRENDGIVEYESCAGGLPFDTFQSTYKSSRYISELNHVDTSFRNGDGLFGDSKKPLKWLECLL
ncbi:unnamed protein product [Peronospora farinosa]|uniref:GPI inositol-deacylase n=1 Tax=Peronospora farinosa TaxID=134698 RepID=A0AAV0UQ92_9STRA|nr:unnamed protein product [Peronospora farinosa]CAI5739087.1 unnamed protein product [Peronospora farinosa]